MSKPCYQISWKPIISQKVLVTQSSNIVHCDWHFQKSYMCTCFKSLQKLSLHKLTFFSFFVGGVKWTAKNFTFCWFWLGKMHHNGLSGMYLGFEVCQIQWHRIQVSMISGSWEIKISGKNFTFCWFWLGKMHQNGLSGMYLGFEMCQIQWHRFQVLYNKWFLKNQNFRQKFHILLILTGKNAS